MLGRPVTKPPHAGFSPLEQLPTELLTQIVCDVGGPLGPDPLALNTLRQVSRQFDAVCRADFFWQKFCPSMRVPGPGGVSLPRYQQFARQAGQWSHELSGHGPPDKGAMLKAAYLLGRFAYAERAELSGRAKNKMFAFGAGYAQQNNIFRPKEQRPLADVVGAKSASLATFVPENLDPAQIDVFFQHNVAKSQLVDEAEALRARLGQLHLSLLRLHPALQSSRSNEPSLWYLRDFDVVRALVPLNPHFLSRTSPELRADLSLMRVAITCDGRSYLHGRGLVRQEPDLFATAIQTYPWLLRDADAAQRGHAAWVDRAASIDVASLFYADAILCDDDAFMLRQIKRDGMALEFASARLKRCPDLCEAAVLQRAEAAQFADPALRSDPAWALRVLQRSGGAMPYLDRSFQTSLRFARAAVANHGSHIVHFARCIQRDRSTVELALQSWGGALERAGELLRQDRRLVFHAVSADGLALRWALGEAAQDPAVVAQALRNNAAAFQFLTPVQQLEPAFLQLFVEALAGDDDLYHNAGYPFDDSVEMKRRLYLVNPRSAISLSAPYADRREVAASFVRQTLAESGLNLRFFNAWVCGSAGFVRFALEQDGLALAFATESLRRDEATVLSAVLQNGLALYYAHPAMQKNLAVVQAAIAQNFMAYEYVHEEVRDHPSIAHVRAAWAAGVRLARSDAQEHISEQEILADQYRDVGDIHAIAAWNGYWGSTTPWSFSLFDALSVDEIEADDLWIFHEGRDFTLEPAFYFTEETPVTGHHLPPPLLDVSFPEALTPFGLDVLPPRYLSSAAFCGELKLRFAADGRPLESGLALA